MGVLFGDRKEPRESAREPRYWYKPTLARARQGELGYGFACKHGIRSPTQTGLTEKGVEMHVFRSHVKKAFFLPENSDASC